MGEKFFKVFDNVADANTWIQKQIILMCEVNSEIFSDGMVIVKYRSTVGKLG